MRVTKRQLKRIIREEAARLQEDYIDTELDHLEKNREDDLEHIRNLRKDIEADQEEAERAREAGHHHNESRRRTSLEQMPDAWRQVLKDCLKGR